MKDSLYEVVYDLKRTSIPERYKDLYHDGDLLLVRGGNFEYIGKAVEAPYVPLPRWKKLLIKWLKL